LRYEKADEQSAPVESLILLNKKKQLKVLGVFAKGMKIPGGDKQRSHCGGRTKNKNTVKGI